jgi:NAD(P)-dependent dehydrogenase (short-subunit alcohol dehydrogenase family)
MDVSTGVAVVTGGASGLGLATARRLAGAGAAVVALDLQAPVDRVTADRPADLLDPATPVPHGEIRWVAGDITDPDSVTGVFAAATRSGDVRAVVHCAGRGGDRVRILDRDGNAAPLDTFMNVVQVNLIGTYNVLRVAAATMAKNEPLDGDRGAVVMTASVAAFEGQIGQTAYTAAKAGVHGITIVAARDLAKWKIRVNTIAPGIFDTPMLGRLPEEMRQALASQTSHPQRLGNPDDYAAMALSLLENGYVNGHTVRLDAGIRMGAR